MGSTDLGHDDTNSQGKAYGSWTPNTSADVGSHTVEASAGGDIDDSDTDGFSVVGDDVLLSIEMDGHSVEAVADGGSVELHARLDSDRNGESITFDAEYWDEDQQQWVDAGSAWPVSGTTGNDPDEADGEAIIGTSLGATKYRFTAWYDEDNDNQQDSGETDQDEAMGVSAEVEPTSVISTFTNTKNQIEVTVHPSEGASYVVLKIEDTEVMTFKGGEAEHQMSGGANGKELVDVFGVPNSPGSTRIGYYVDSETSHTSASSSRHSTGIAPESALRQMEGEGAEEAFEWLIDANTQRISTSFNDWVSFATDPVAAAGEVINHMAKQNIDETLDEMLDGTPEEMAAAEQAFDILENHGGYVRLAQNSDVLAALALDFILDAYVSSDHTFMDMQDLSPGGYSPVVPPGIHESNTFEAHAGLRLIHPSDMISHIDDLDQYLSNPNSFVQGFDAGFEWTVNSKHVITGSMNIPFGKGFLDESPVSDVTFTATLHSYNWRDAEFHVDLSETLNTQTGDFSEPAISVGLQFNF